MRFAGCNYLCAQLPRLDGLNGRTGKCAARRETKRGQR